MIVRRLLPAGAPAAGSPTVDLDSSGGGLTLDEWYAPPERLWLRTNLVAGVDGGARDPAGISDGLSNRVDRRILGTIRRSADVVLVGAATVRAEGFRVPSSAGLAVVTATGDFGGAVLDAASAERVTVYCPSDARASVIAGLPHSGVRVVDLPSSGSRIDAVSLVTALRATGAEAIVCEGGPSLVGQLLDAGLVDELCLTTSPSLAGSAVPVFAGGGTGAGLELTDLFADDLGTLFARWRVTAAGARRATR